MSKRKPISKKLRFEVFKRDSFSCQYCGASAPDVVLHIDHIHPVSKGGDNDILNLITSCESCNNGKRDILLSDNSMLEKQKQQLDELNEKREQLEMMIAWREELKGFDNDIVCRAAEYFEECINNVATVNENGLVNMKKWVKRFDFELLLEAIDKSVEQYFNVDDYDSVGKAFSMIPRIANIRKKEKETGRSESHLFYIRGIIRNRFHYCNDWKAIELLRKADELDVPEEELKQIALQAKNWSQWRVTMNAIVGEEYEY